MKKLLFILVAVFFFTLGNYNGKINHSKHYDIPDTCYENIILKKDLLIDTLYFEIMDIGSELDSLILLNN